MSTDGCDAAQVDHRAVPAAEPELRAEGMLPDPVQPGVQLIHRRVQRPHLGTPSCDHPDHPYLRERCRPSIRWPISMTTGRFDMLEERT
jgi:hypothetical protein